MSNVASRLSSPVARSVITPPNPPTPPPLPTHGELDCTCPCVLRFPSPVQASNKPDLPDGAGLIGQPLPAIWSEEVMFHRDTGGRWSVIRLHRQEKTHGPFFFLFFSFFSSFLRRRMKLGLRPKFLRVQDWRERKQKIKKRTRRGD